MGEFITADLSINTFSIVNEIFSVLQMPIILLFSAAYPNMALAPINPKQSKTTNLAIYVNTYSKTQKKPEFLM